jgi:hypothetical protein
MKMMRMGMNLYIDLKGKKKENRGIEFPIKREGESGFGGGGFGNNNQSSDQNQQGNNQQRGGFDKKAMRSRYAIYMLSMKLFGFTDDEPTPQELQRDGSVNLNYSWDSTDVMYIEYLVPLKLLGDATSLNQKTISLGWKINGIDASSFNTGVTSSSGTLVGRSSDGRTITRSAPSSPSTSSPSQNQSFDSMMEEKNFWMKYVFH